ncbi:fused MFS/spermidine synthase [Candidatus Chlorohelix sp.]|uniref:spermidine synthase n=1 Tax=Candidatus Chlorohelix sp. TaxID=3139201 RepID=UPI0030211DE2
MAIEPKNAGTESSKSSGFGDTLGRNGAVQALVEGSSAPALAKPPFLLTIVFVGGMSVMATELCASRLLAPYFGTSLLIWANIIGFVIVYLAIGYYLGGRLADRFPRPEVLYQLTAFAGLAMGLIPFLTRPILDIAYDAFRNVNGGIFYGSLVGILLLFSAPVILLGCVTPFAVHLRARNVTNTGKAAGGISSLSTIGSILGTFIPALILIPLVGTRTTMYAFSLVLLAFSTVGLFLLRSRRVPVYAGFMAIILALAVLTIQGVTRPAVNGELVFEKESADNYIQVVKRPVGDGTFRFDLVLNEGRAVHSIYYQDPNRILTGGPWDYYMISPFFNKDIKETTIKRSMLIGLGAGTVSKQLTRAYGANIQIEGIEVDPEIIEVGRKYFDMNEPNLKAIADDGRYYLITSKEKYDIIGMDAYKQPYIPFHLTTQEFFKQVRDHLTPTGVAVVNAGAPEYAGGKRDYRLVEALASTMKTVYPNVYLVNVDGYFNTMVIGTNQPTSIENFRENITKYVSNDLIKTVGATALEKGDIREWTKADAFFTDDLAPVERVIDTIILDYALGGGK